MDQLTNARREALTLLLVNLFPLLLSFRRCEVLLSRGWDCVEAGQHLQSYVPSAANSHKAETAPSLGQTFHLRWFKWQIEPEQMGDPCPRNIPRYLLH